MMSNRDNQYLLSCKIGPVLVQSTNEFLMQRIKRGRRYRGGEENKGLIVLSGHLYRFHGGDQKVDENVGEVPSRSSDDDIRDMGPQSLLSLPGLFSYNELLIRVNQKR